jgi:hypothetical protein
MFAFADPARIARVLTGAGWTPPRIDPLDIDLDIAAGQGLDAAVAQSTEIGAVSSWLRGQPPEVIQSATEAIRTALAPYQQGANVHLRGAAWLVSSSA